MVFIQTVPAGLVVASVLIALAACGSSSSEAAAPSATIVADVRPYLSVKELRASSDSVLLGTFGNKTGTQRDNGGNPADVGGIPVAFYEFLASRVLSGRDLGPTAQVSFSTRLLRTGMLLFSLGQAMRTGLIGH